MSDPTNERARTWPANRPQPGPSTTAPPPPAQPALVGYPPQYYPHPPPGMPFPPIFAAPPGPDGQPQAPYVMMMAPPGYMYVPYPPPAQGPPTDSNGTQVQPAPVALAPVPLSVDQPRAKRRQVKQACVNCASACKRCDDARPCQRCVKYGLADACKDVVRKPRQKGFKRGPYKRKNKSGEDEDPASASSPPASANAPQQPVPEGYYPVMYPPPPGWVPAPGPGQEHPPGAPPVFVAPPPGEQGGQHPPFYAMPMPMPYPGYPSYGAPYMMPAPAPAPASPGKSDKKNGDSEAGEGEEEGSA